MIKIDEENMPGSTWNKAEASEPVFVLRAQDRLAPYAVRMWAQLARSHGVTGQKINEAARLADAMEYWENRKIPD